MTPIPTPTLTERFATLRRERATFERTHRAQAYPRAFKRLVLELYREMRQMALTDYQIARKLGVHIETLRRWDKAAPLSPPPSPASAAAAPLPVTVRVDRGQPLLGGSVLAPRTPASPPRQSAAPGAPGGITLVAPSGWRLENLELEQALVVLDKLARQASC